MPYEYGSGSKCAVIGCQNSQKVLYKWYRENCPIHNEKHADCPCLKPFNMHFFPKDELVRRRWIAKINRKGYEPGKKATVCSIHFVDGRPSEENAVPELHMGYKSCRATNSPISVPQLKNLKRLNPNAVRKSARIRKSLAMELKTKQIIEDALATFDLKRERDEKEALAKMQMKCSASKAPTTRRLLPAPSMITPRLETDYDTEFEILIHSFWKGKVALETIQNCNLMYTCSKCKQILVSVLKLIKHYENCDPSNMNGVNEGADEPVQMQIDEEPTTNENVPNESSVPINKICEPLVSTGPMGQKSAESQSSTSDSDDLQEGPNVAKDSYTISFCAEEKGSLVLKDPACTICIKKFATVFSLFQHYASKHLKLKSYKCNLCDFTSEYETECKKHYLELHPQVDFKMNRFFEYYSSLRVDMEAQPESEFETLVDLYWKGKVPAEILKTCGLSYECKTCKNSFSKIESYLDHCERCNSELRTQMIISGHCSVQIEVADEASDPDSYFECEPFEYVPRLEFSTCGDDSSDESTGITEDGETITNIKIKREPVDEDERREDVKETKPVEIVQENDPIRNEPINVCEKNPEIGDCQNEALEKLELPKTYVVNLTPEEEKQLDLVNLRCRLCFRKFAIKRFLLEHYAVQHLEYKRFSCRLCKFVTDSNCEYKTHGLEVHQKENPLDVFIKLVVHEHGIS